MEKRQIADTRARIEDAREALIVFVIISGAASLSGDDCQRRRRGSGRRRLHGTCDGFPLARPAGEFDDSVPWIPAARLLCRMMGVGALP